MRIALLSLFCGLICRMALAQPAFSVELEELDWPQIPALHSFAYAEHDGKWLFIGGRTNGLHGFLPPLAFPNSGRNTDITVFDPATGQRWDYPVSALHDSIREAVSTSNMEFYQQDSTLYMVGGYGWNALAGTFISYPTLTAVDVPGLMSAIQNSTPIPSYFRQISYDSLRVCGGHLACIDSTYLLVFGHRFDGIYDREDTTGFHVQTYTHALRRFRIQDDGQNLALQWEPAWVDTLNFRRRDYNLVPQVFPDGSMGYTAFSGVFQKGINLPYLFPIDVHADSARPRLGFDQQLANYHCAVLPLYDSAANAMHTLFFGGEALYRYDSAGTLMMDTLVPFVNTISMLSRDAQGVLSEYKLDSTMPGLLGSNAQFLPHRPNVTLTPNGVIRLDAISGRTLVGYVMGGIESPFPNISDTDPSQSWASGRVFAVYVHPNPLQVAHQAAVSPIKISAAPNPFRESIRIRVESSSVEPLEVDILDTWGRSVKTLHSGPHDGEISVRWRDAAAAGTYFIRARSGSYVKLQRILRVD